MSPPFARNGRPRGPPPFVVQMLRAPLSINNIVAFAITQSVYRSQQATILASEHSRPCAMRVNAIFGMLAILYAVSTMHNVMNFVRMARIRRQVFGESMCAARRRWRRQGECVLDEEEKKARWAKFKEMGKRMPSLVISVTDIFLAVGFLGMWVLTTLIAKREGKIELGVAYASIGALVAFILNLIIGLNGVKFWAIKQRREREARLEEAGEVTVSEKERLIMN